MDQQPKYYQLDRRTIGVLSTSKRVIEAIAAASALSQYPWMALILIAIRVGISDVLASAVASNPLSVSASQTVTAAPEVGLPTVEPITTTNESTQTV